MFLYSSRQPYNTYSYLKSDFYFPKAMSFETFETVDLESLVTLLSTLPYFKVQNTSYLSYT